MMPWASTPKSSTPLGIRKPFTGLFLPILLQELAAPVEAPDGAIRGVAHQHAVAGEADGGHAPEQSSRRCQVSSSLPARSKISICRTSPTYTEPSPATATENPGRAVAPAP